MGDPFTGQQVPEMGGYVNSYDRPFFDRKEAVEQTESVKQAETIASVVKETPGQKLRREIERIRQQHSQRRSGGMHV